MTETPTPEQVNAILQDMTEEQRREALVGICPHCFTYVGEGNSCWCTYDSPDWGGE